MECALEAYLMGKIHLEKIPWGTPRASQGIGFAKRCKQLKLSSRSRWHHHGRGAVSHDLAAILYAV